MPLNSEFDEPDSKAADAQLGHCPVCLELIVVMRFGRISQRDTTYYQTGFLPAESKIVFPFNPSGRQIPSEVPENLSRLFRKAEAVLPISPEASATLSRRVLQQVFREHLSIKKKDLNQEIDEFIARSDVPSYLIKSVDGIRAIGNYAAHPIKYQNSGEMVDVEEGEAEWSLDTLESLFDFVFVQPTKLEEQRKKLNAKNELAGKPKLKGSGIL